MNDFTKDMANALFNQDKINDLFRQKLQQAVNDLLESELTAFLGYNPYERDGWNTGNSRNGAYFRKVDTQFGEIEIQVPRDRNGMFHQHTLPDYKQHSNVLESMIIKLYSKGVTTREIAKAITDLRHEFMVSLNYVLDAIAEHPELPTIARSSYYKIIKRKPKKPKRSKLIARIKEIFNRHKGRYGYRRVALQLIKEGWNITEKIVRYWMHKLGLKGIRRNKRKYSSYKGTIGKIAPNLIRRDFFAPMSNMKWYTDITEFHLNGEKLYLSPILDGCGGDIVSYTISKHPDMELVMTMLDRAFAKETALNNCIFHTDQGCQYQSPRYQRALKLHGITQSMSRKGNSMDDGLMKNFFGLLKTEVFYDQEYKYHSLQELTQAIEEYIEYYNEERIKSRLKGLTPKEYRNQASINPVF